MWLRLHSRGMLAGIMRKIKIGLALGSGAARGWSHIGVINALQKVGIEIDIVAGCSIGSLGGRGLCMRSIICAGRLGDLFQLLGCFTPDGSLLAARRAAARRAGVQSIPAKLCRKQRSKTVHRRFAAVATNLSTGQRIMVYGRRSPSWLFAHHAVFQD